MKTWPDTHYIEIVLHDIKLFDVFWYSLQCSFRNHDSDIKEFPPDRSILGKYFRHHARRWANLRFESGHHGQGQTHEQVIKCLFISDAYQIIISGCI